MRAFIVLSLAAIVCADVGYNYQAGGGSHSIGGHNGHVGSSGLSTHGVSSLGGQGSSIRLGGLGGIGGTSGLGGIGGSSGLGGIGGSSGLGNAGLGGVSSGPVSVSLAAPVQYEKEFYTFSAPESEFNNDNAGQQIVSVKKNLRVIFIKAPENKGLENAALQLAKQTTEEKTAIYVLTKQPDIGNLAQQLQTINSQQSNKPEVHFVKYRTPEDAANAQKAIQSQYDQLSGKSQTHNGGVAPVLNFASRGPVAPAPAPKAPANSYLPSSILRLFRA